MRCWIIFAVALVPAFAPAATTAPATTQSIEQLLAAHKEQERTEYFHQLDSQPELKLPTGNIGDIFEMAIEHDIFVVRPILAATDGPVCCKVNGFVGPCSVAVFADRNAPDKSITAVQFAHRDFSNEKEIFRHTMLFAHAGSVQLSMDLDSLVLSKSVSLIEDLDPADPDSAVRLSGELIDPITDDVIAQYNLAAPTFRALRLKYPRQIQEFVVPILRDLQQQTLLAPDAPVAYQVFQNDYKPDEKLSRQIATSVAKFDSDQFQDREQAAKDLEALGQPAALALMHANRTNWSIDRASGVDAFLAQYKAMPPERLNSLRKDPIFLLDCLYSKDAAIRAAAAQRLHELTHIFIDPAVISPQREVMIDQIYSQLFQPLSKTPTTHD